MLICRVFISTLVVIQNNPNVQTQGDRLIKVGCIISNATLQETREDENIDLKLQVEDQTNNLYDNNNSNNNNDTNDGMPNPIALESSLEFTQRLERNLYLMVLLFSYSFFIYFLVFCLMKVPCILMQVTFIPCPRLLYKL